MKKYLIGSILFLVPFAGYAQSKFSNAIGAGLDYNYDVYFNYNNYTRYQVDQAFNIDLDGAFQASKKLRLRLEVDYTNFGYGQRYNYSPAQISSNALVKSEITIHNLSLTPRVDYKLIMINKFDIYASAGFKFEMNLGKKEETYTNAGEKFTSSYIDNSYEHFMQGIAGGLLFKYNILKHFSVNLTPDYTYFLQKFYRENDGNLQRVSVNLGLEWRY